MKSAGMKLNTRFILIFILCLLVNSAFAYPLNLDETKRKYDLGYSVEYYEDVDATLTLQDVIQLDNDNKFRTSSIQPMNFGYSKSTYWLSFNVDGQTESKSGWVLDIPYAPLDYVKIYIPDGKGGYSEIVTGDKVPFQQKQLNYRNPVFVLGDRLLSYQQYYVKVSSDGAINLPMFLWTGSGFSEHVSDVQTGMGIYIGVMLALLLYNLFLYFSIRDKDFLLCSFIIISYTLVQMSYNGMATQYLWPNWIWWANNSLPFFAILIFLSIALFTKSFLNLKHYTPLGNKLFIGFIVYYLLLYPLFFILGYRLTSLATALSGIVLLVIVFFQVIYVYSKGFKAARYLFFAWVFFLSGMALLLLKLIGVLPHVFITEYSVQIGFTLNAALLSFALADKINILREEKQEAQRIALARLEESERLKTDFLAETERIVDERTKELEELNKNLVEMASFDVLTGLYNRRVFNEAINREFSRARRIGEEIALIMIDIDLFKNYNDTYGHLEGDNCLVELSAIFKSLVNRSTDVVARFGGEEFAIILCGTNTEGAQKIAESIREAVFAACFPHKMSPFGVVTVSCGVAAKIPDMHDTPDDLIKKADDALYKAKENGRNNVYVSAY